MSGFRGSISYRPPAAPAAPPLAAAAAEKLPDAISSKLLSAAKPDKEETLLADVMTLSLRLIMPLAERLRLLLEF
jgi:hypothetical protein